MDEPNPILRLLKSSKGLVAITVILASYAAMFLGKASWDQIDSMIKWVLTVWMGSQAVEDAATKLAAPKLLAAKHNVATAEKMQKQDGGVALPSSLVPPP